MRFKKWVTGIYGVFLRTKNPKMLAAWLEQHVGMEFGANLNPDFSCSSTDDPALTGLLSFPFKKTTTTIFILQKTY
jgi:hypothetical protein